MLPLVSVAVQFTRVVPGGKALGASLTMAATPKMSVADAVPMSTNVRGPAAVTLMFPGGAMTGGVASRTVISTVSVVSAPFVSLTTRVTIVVPSGNCAVGRIPPAVPSGQDHA